MHWWGPEGFDCPSAKINLQPGGESIYCMHGPAGSEWDRDMYSGGIFHEIIPERKITLTTYFCDSDGRKIAPSEEKMPENFPEEQNVTVLFEDAEEGASLLRIRYSLPADENQRKAMIDSGIEQGWESSLKKLEGCLKTF